jgi:hypothetical protein
MKKGIMAVAGATLLVSASWAQFTAGNLAVSVIGDGAAALSSAAAQVKVQEYTVGGIAGFSVVLPNLGSSPKRLTTSGTATSEGFLTRSVDGNYLTIQGYDADKGTASVVSSTTPGTQRVVGCIDMFGNMDTTTAFNAYSGNNIRSSVTVDGSQFWTGGTAATQGGVETMGLGGTGLTQVSTTVTNIRVVNIFGSQLYCSSSSGAFLGVSTVGTGLPTGSGNTISLQINTGTGSSPYDFFFSDANTCYIADDRATGSGGGLQKWTYSGSAWSLAYTLNANLTAGLRGLAGVVDAGSGITTLYATTADSISAANGNKLVKVDDTGSGAAFSTIATAAGNTAFRGVDLTPVPEPASVIALAMGVALIAARYRKR